jgi:hypothetical protein
MPVIPLPLPPETYDAPWKGALAAYFSDFMAFYFPDMATDIDWSRPPVFLDKELTRLAHDAALGTRLADHLVQIHTRNGGKQWMLIHVEVQAQHDGSLPERMHVYQYRIYDRFRHPVACLVVLADRGRNWRPSRFSYRWHGCGARTDFRCVKLRDYARRLERLQKQDNPFALLTAAHLLTQQTRGQPQQRHAAKWKLARLLFARDWDRQRIINLFHVIDWIMRLPKELEDQLWQDIIDLEGRKAMDTYVPRGARIAMMRELNEAREKAQREGWLEGQRKGWEDGKAQGLQQGLFDGLLAGRQEGHQLGRQEGRQEGRLEGRQEGRQEGLADGLRQGQAALLTRLLVKRFGPLPPDAQTQVGAADLHQLEAWAEAALDARTLDDVLPRH